MIKLVVGGYSGGRKIKTQITISSGLCVLGLFLLAFSKIGVPARNRT